MPDELRSLWLRAIADLRRELERLKEDQPGIDPESGLDSLFAAGWPKAREAAIEGLAREEAGDDERLYRDVRRRLDRDLPREYPYARHDEDSNQ